MAADTVRFIIPTIGRDTLPLTLNSLKKQTNQNFIVELIFDGVDSTIASDDKYRTRVLSKQIGTKEKGRTGKAGMVRNEALREAWGGWTAFLDDDDSIREDYVELLLTKYSKYDIVIFRMVGGKTVFPPIGNDDLIYGRVGISFAFNTSKFDNVLFEKNSHMEDYELLVRLVTPSVKFVVTDEIVYYIGNTLVPRTIADLVINNSTTTNLLILYKLLRGGSGVSILIMPPGKFDIMGACTSFLVDSLTMAGIKTTIITSLSAVVDGTTLLTYLNTLEDGYGWLPQHKKYPIIVINTEPKMDFSRADRHNLKMADLVLEYDMSCPGNGLFLPAMFFGSEQEKKEKAPLKYTAGFAGTELGIRKHLFDFLCESGICVTNFNGSLDYITKLSESKLAPMIPRCKNGIEVHRLASIISAGCPRVVYYYPHLTSNVQFMALLSDVITFAQTEDYFVIKCADALKEDHEMRRAKDAAWWERQRIPYLFSDILEYVDSKIKKY